MKAGSRGGRGVGIVSMCIEHADILSLKSDAVVVPTNSLGIMSQGLAYRIRTHGGASIQTDVMHSAPLSIGSAVVSGGGKLPIPYIIHVPTVSEPGQMCDREVLRMAIQAALIASMKRKFHSISFPGMGLDEYSGDGLLPEEYARTVVEEMAGHKKPASTEVYPKQAYLVSNDLYMIEIFKQAKANISKRGS